MHRRLAEARTDPRLQQWEQKWKEALEHAREDQVIFDRELFYAVQPRDRLESMIEQYTQMFSTA